MSMQRIIDIITEHPMKVILGIALIIRAIYFIERLPHMGEEFLIVDSLFHHNWAVAIANGQFIGQEPFFRAPLYPYVLGALYYVFGPYAQVGFIFGQLLGLVSILLTFKICLSIFDKKTATIAGLIQTLYPLHIFFEGELLVEGLFIVFIQLSVIGIMKAGKSIGFKWPLLTGLFIGLAALTRPVILALIPLYLIWYCFASGNLKNRVTGLGIICLMIVLTILPITMRNMIVGQDFVPIASSGGVNFYLGNNEIANGLSPAMPPPLGASWQIKDIRHIAETEAGRELKPSEISGYYFGQAIDWIWSNKSEFAKLYLKKLYYLINDFEISNNRNLIHEYSKHSILKYNPISFYLIFGLAMLGILAQVFISEASGHRVFLIGFVLLYGITISFFFINARFRLPIMPLLIVFSSSGIVYIYNYFKNWRFDIKSIAIFITAIVVSGVSLTNWYEHDDNDVSSGYFNTANVYLAGGEYELARDNYHKVLDSRPGYPDAAINLGVTMLKMGQVDSAQFYFEKELSNSPDSPKAYSNLASIYILKANYDSALALADKSIELKPYFLDPYLIKLRVYASLSDSTGINKTMTAVQENVDNPERAFFDAGVVFTEWGDHNKAEGFLMAAYDAKPGSAEMDDNAFSHASKTSGGTINIKSRASYQLGYLYGLMGDYNESIEYSNTAIALDSNLVEAYINLSSGYLSIGDINNARAIADLAFKKFPNNTTVGILHNRLQ